MIAMLFQWSYRPISKPHVSSESLWDRNVLFSSNKNNNRIHTLLVSAHIYNKTITQEHTIQYTHDRFDRRSYKDWFEHIQIWLRTYYTDLIKNMTQIWLRTYYTDLIKNMRIQILIKNICRSWWRTLLKWILICKGALTELIFSYRKIDFSYIIAYIFRNMCCQ